MDDRFNDNDVQSLARDIRDTAAELRVNAVLSLSYTADILNRFLDIEMAKYGASRARSAVLNVLIVSGGSLTPTEISKRVFRSKHTITRILDGLEASGLIKREQVPGDRRKTKIVVTKKALEFIKLTDAGRREISSKALSCLDPEEVRQLNTLLRKLRKHLLSYIYSVTGQTAQKGKSSQ